MEVYRGEGGTETLDDTGGSRVGGSHNTGNTTLEDTGYPEAGTEEQRLEAEAWGSANMW